MEFEEFKDKVIEKYEDAEERSLKDFEKQLTYISSGVLIGTMIFIDKIVSLQDASCKFLLVLTWILIGVSLILIMFSHFISSILLRKTKMEFTQFEKGEERFSQIISKKDKRNKKIDVIHTITVIPFILGIICLILFVSLNI